MDSSCLRRFLLKCVSKNNILILHPSLFLNYLNNLCNRMNPFFIFIHFLRCSIIFQLAWKSSIALFLRSSSNKSSAALMKTIANLVTLRRLENPEHFDNISYKKKLS